MQTIYYTGVDGGDGSVTVEFFDDQRSIDLLEKFDYESYRGEGGGSFQAEDHDIGLVPLQETIERLTDYGYATQEQIDEFLQ